MGDSESLNLLSNTDYDLDLFFKFSPDLFCIAGYDGYFKKISPSFQKLLGYTSDELYGTPINSFLYGEDIASTAEIRENIIGGTVLKNFENRYQTKNGEVVWLSWTSFPVPEEKLVYAIARNVTPRKEIEGKKNEWIRYLTQTNDKLKQLTFTTSHDLRAPVNNLLAVFQLIDIQKIEDKETFELVELLQQSTEGLKQKLDNFLTTLKQESSEQLKVETLSLKDIYYQTTITIQSLIENSGAVLLPNFTEVPDIEFNRMYLESIFLNLITNSIKYSKPNVKPLIEIKSFVKNGTVKVSFTDNGLGFDMEQVKMKLFGFDQKFHSHKESQGIGLYLVHAHVTALGGKIDVKSKPRQGTEFIISFPNLD
ncbi:PAS domain-containing sensor histidine kinase [Cyclobacterium jeungdonense]|uniref:histidine kinase n=1 Tax=Cyclobacterium jeungdonense TaxID=708087 RepID=A0ABT8CCL4_9BACT|nr:PAS domain-containing sensor histidine kinase [Cyclobacterium jeungdonense]MDN3690549.1 PAS domain-containing sensor histidine kinase [Cyclobacterium jeungdonense]